MSENGPTQPTVTREPSPEILAAQERALVRAMESLPPGPMHLLLNRTAWLALTQQAKALGRTAFVPDHLRPSYRQAKSMKPAEQEEYTAANVVGALLLAASLGESPFQVMSDVYFVGGRPAWKTEALIARLRRALKISLRWRIRMGDKPISGRYMETRWENGERVEHERQFTGPDLHVTCYATMPGESEALEVSVTMAEAIADGWVSNGKYATLPERMLRWRAASYWISLYAPEVKSGIPMDVDLESLPAREPAGWVEPAPVAALPAPAPLPVEEMIGEVEPLPVSTATGARQADLGLGGK